MKKFSKKNILLAAAALVVTVGLVVGAVFLAKRRPKFITPEQLGIGEQGDTEFIAAHGLSALAPSNSAAAFALAGKNGYQGIQFEVRRTADGVWVVMEEETINDATSGRGRVDKMTFKQILSCRIDKGHGRKRYKEDQLTVATLDQALSACSQYGMTPVIDVRISGTEHLEALIQAVGSRQNLSCVLVFNNDEQLAKAGELLTGDSAQPNKGSLQLCRFVEKLNKKALDEAKKTPKIAVCFPAKKNDKAKAIQPFIEAGITLYARGVNKAKPARTLYEAGVRRFITDKLAGQEIVVEELSSTVDPKKRPTTSPAKENEQSSGRAANPSAPAKDTTKPSAPAKNTTKPSASAKKATKPSTSAKRTTKPAQNAQ